MKIPSYAKASEGYPPVAKSAEAVQHIDIDDSDTTYAFIHGQARGLLRRRIKSPTLGSRLGSSMELNEAPYSPAEAGRDIKTELAEANPAFHPPVQAAGYSDQGE